MPFLAYYGCSKLLKARAVFYWGTHTRFTVSVGIDLSLTKTRRTRSAGCICMDKRARISPLWEIVYYLDTCIVYLAVRETEYFTEILRNIPRMREQWCPGRFFPPPQKTAWERGYMQGCLEKMGRAHCLSIRTYSESCRVSMCAVMSITFCSPESASSVSVASFQRF